jgi:acyl carrier protein
MTPRESSLREMLAELMEIEARELSLTMTFAEQGVDSLVGLRFARRIQDVTGIDVELEWVFDYPTIRQLAKFIDARLNLI